MITASAIELIADLFLEACFHRWVSKQRYDFLTLYQLCLWLPAKQKTTSGQSHILWLNKGIGST